MISTIIPCYNAVATLERAVNSCLIQTEITEIIIVDDCSTDASLALAHRLATEHSKIKVFQLGKNSGPATARNFGVLNSTSPLLSFLDADDEYLPNGLFVGCQALNQHASLAAVKLSCEFVDFPKKYSQHSSFSEACATLINTFAGNLIIRREIFFALGLFPQEAIFREHGGEDGVLMVLLRELCLVGLVNQKGACMNIHFHANSHSQMFFDVCAKKAEDPSFVESRDNVWEYSMYKIAQIKQNMTQLQVTMASPQKGFVPIWKTDTGLGS